MLSNHFPFTYGHSHAWLILVALMAIGACVRHYFNLRHVGRNAWWIPVTAAAGVVALALALEPSTPSSQGSGPPPTIAQVQSIVQARCAPCHSMTPTEPGYPEAPAGIHFDTAAETESQASLIRAFAVQTDTMPPGNATHMTSGERATLARWLAAR